MVDVGKMIATIRREHRLSQTQLATKIGCTKQTISNYERGLREPDYVTLEAIADALNVPMSMLISREDQKKALNAIFNSYNIPANNSDRALRIPVLGSIPAGIPMEAIEDVVDWEEIPAEWTRGGKEYFALKITGDSMYPRYEDGDVLILRKQETCESGQDCAVMVNGEDATFKRVKRSDQGITLLPINPDYDPRTFSNKEILELPVRIIGVVVELRRTL